MTLRGIAASALAVCFFAFASAAGETTATTATQARSADTLVAVVTFDLTGAITVALPNGTPVGTTTGSPTLIPAGYYSFNLASIGPCTWVPYFELLGPGVNIADNMDQGEEYSSSDVVNLQPNSTYTWASSDAPTVIHTFRTSADVVGTKPVAVKWTGPFSTKATTSSDIVGSNIAKGTLAASVAANGTVALTMKGKPVTKLASGKYTLTITDKSTNGGLVLVPAKHHALNLTSASFVGKRSVLITLSAGKWSITSKLGSKTSPLVVS